MRIQGTLGKEVEVLRGLRTGSFRFGPIGIRRLSGSPIFVEYDQDKYPYFAPGKTIEVSGRLVSFDDYSELRRESAALKAKLQSDFPQNPKIIIVDERPFGDWRYPLLFALSVFALLASFWSAIRRANEGNAI